MEKDAKEILRIKLRPDLNKLLEEAVKRKQTDRTKLVAQLLTWFLDQDNVLQSVILGQIDPAEDVVELILTRRRRPPGKRGSPSLHRMPGE